MIKFRELKTQDIEQIYVIEQQSFDDAWTKDQLLYEINEQAVAECHGLFEGDNLIGYILCHFIQNELHINNIAIGQQYRRQGHGTELINRTFEMLNPETVFLEVNVNNSGAIRLYENLGFKSFYTRENYYKDGSDALIMIL